MIPGAGGYYDPADRGGLATWSAAMMREGTATRSSAQISEALETMGASLFTSGGTSSTNGEIDGSALTESLPKLMDLTADVLLHPAFAPAEWDRYKARTKPQFTQLRTNPAFLANEMFNKVVFGTHPASRIFPSATAIDVVTAPISPSTTARTTCRITRCSRSPATSRSTRRVAHDEIPRRLEEARERRRRK